MKILDQKVLPPAPPDCEKGCRGHICYPGSGKWKRLGHLNYYPLTSPVLFKGMKPFQVAVISQIAVWNCMGEFQVCAKIIIPLSFSPSSYSVWSQWFILCSSPHMAGCIWKEGEMFSIFFQSHWKKQHLQLIFPSSYLCINQKVFCLPWQGSVTDSWWYTYLSDRQIAALFATTKNPLLCCWYSVEFSKMLIKFQVAFT